MAVDAESPTSASPRSSSRRHRGTTPQPPSSASFESSTTTNNNNNGGKVMTSSFASSVSSKCSLGSLRSSLPENPHLYDISEIRTATNNFLAKNFSSSSSCSCFSAFFWGCWFLLLIMYLGSNNHHHRGRRYHHRLNKDDGGMSIDHHHHHHHHNPTTTTLAIDHHGDTSDDHHPASAGSLRRQIAASLMRHHQYAERNKHALQPLSPASYGSSFEMAAYNPAATPDSSVELRGRIGESSYGFKTSTELLKVLNRIWSLEEQHASNMSLVKALKNELDHSRAKIKELLRDQQANRHEVDQLMKQISEGNLTRRSKEQDRIEATLQSVREELENERKLRKRSESLHRKLARELFEIKVSLATTVKDLEKERKSTELLEELCDEFAKGVKEYARQAQEAKQKLKSSSDNDWTDLTDHDNLIMHISESWLDERMQIENGSKSSVVDRLRPEIESFLAARQVAVITTTKDELSPCVFRHQSLESIPERTSAPQSTGRPDSSTFADTQPEIPKVGPTNVEDSVQMSDPQNTPQEIEEGIPTTGVDMLQKSEIYDALIKEGVQQRNVVSSKKTVDKLMSELLVSEGGSELKNNKDGLGVGNPVLRRNASPVRQWMNIMKSPGGSRMPDSGSQNVAVQEMKSKEQKSKGQRSRLKFLKGSAK